MNFSAGTYSKLKRGFFYSLCHNLLIEREEGKYETTKIHLAATMSQASFSLVYTTM